MSYLYSTFAQLVSVHCKATAATSMLPVNQCKRNLLSYGYEKLQTFSDEQLDAFDPYQRGASELIWSSIMREHPDSTLITTRQPIPIPPATSIIILTHQNPVDSVTSTKDEATSSSSSDSQHYPSNPIFDNTDAENDHAYAMDMDIAYGYPAQPAMNPSQVEIFDIPEESQAHSSESEQQQQKKEQNYLTGPLVVRVRPDGTPVEEDQYKPLPDDDDLEAFHVNTAVVLPPTPATPVQTIHAAAGRPTKHRKIATISALKQQYLSTLALQQQLQPPLAQPAQELQPPLEQTRPRARRQFPEMGTFSSYFSA